MEPSERVLFEENWEEPLEDDVEMLDAELVDGHCSIPVPEAVILAEKVSGAVACCGRSCEEACYDKGGENGLANAVGGRRRKKNKKRKRGGSAANITDINRFVINTCRQLKEKKSYLIWNAVGHLGVSAISDLVKEVNAIQHCGGQKTIDGKRFRTGGGVLWNILKIREPKAYKEIMAKGKEFEKQFKQPQNKVSTKKNVISQCKIVSYGAAEHPVTEISESARKPLPVWDRVRVPVTYDDDLLEEGEMQQETSFFQLQK